MEENYPLKKQIKTNPEVSSLFTQGDFSSMKLKEDHESKPLWITPTGHIFMDTSSPIYQQITDFLVAVSEPVSRPKHIHEYIITRYSLYAAVSVKLETEYIIDVLTKHSKTEEIPESVKSTRKQNPSITDTS